MEKNLERQVVELVATDRISIPVKSMAGKLDRARPRLAEEVANSPEFTGDYVGKRVYAKIVSEDKMKARGMRDAIEVFSSEFPKYGKILNGMIEEQRALRETHLFFGMYDGCRMTSDDYAGVMADLGFTPAESESLYQKLMDISRKLSRKRNEERSIIIG